MPPFQSANFAHPILRSPAWGPSPSPSTEASLTALKGARRRQHGVARP